MTRVNVGSHRFTCQSNV